MRLDPEQRLAGIAASVLLLTLFLPWYQKSVAVGSRIVEDNESAFGVFTFVEAAVLVVALGVFGLLYARSQSKPFHLPGGDGTVIFAAGAWSAVLLLWRVFDRPDVSGPGATVGITWGFFFAFLAAGALAAAGWRIRVAGRPEPPNPAEAPLPVRRPARRVVAAEPEPETEVTRRVRAERAPEPPTERAPSLFDDPGDPGDAPTRRVPASDDPPFLGGEPFRRPERD